MLRLAGRCVNCWTVRSRVATALWLLADFLVIPSSAESATGKVLLLVDIHFDPLANPFIVSRLICEDVSLWPAILADPSSSKQARLSILGQDTNYGLFQSTICAVANQKPFDFVVLLGDYLRHKFKDTFVQAGRAPGGFPGLHDEDRHVRAEYSVLTTCILRRQTERQ
jgi:hypothetical protein